MVKPGETTDAAAEDMDEAPESAEPDEMPTIAAEDYGDSMIIKLLLRQRNTSRCIVFSNYVHKREDGM